MVSKINAWIRAYKKELNLSKREVKAWKIIILLGGFVGFMLCYFLRANGDTFADWLHPLNKERAGAFAWFVLGGVFTFLVLYAKRLLDYKEK